MSSIYIPFKQQYSFKQRRTESMRVLIKYSDAIPIICERVENQPTLPCIDRKKYLVSKQCTLGQFLMVIRKRLHVQPTESLYLLINGKTMSNTLLLQQIYYREMDEDGFLYIYYAKENIFGG